MDEKKKDNPKLEVQNVLSTEKLTSGEEVGLSLREEGKIADFDGLPGGTIFGFKYIHIDENDQKKNALVIVSDRCHLKFGPKNRLKLDKIRAKLRKENREKDLHSELARAELASSNTGRTQKLFPIVLEESVRVAVGFLGEEFPAGFPTECNFLEKNQQHRSYTEFEADLHDYLSRNVKLEAVIAMGGGREEGEKSLAFYRFFRGRSPSSSLLLSAQKKSEDDVDAKLVKLDDNHIAIGFCAEFMLKQLNTSTGVMLAEKMGLWEGHTTLLMKLMLSDIYSQGLRELIGYRRDKGFIKAEDERNSKKAPRSLDERGFEATRSEWNWALGQINISEGGNFVVITDDPRAEPIFGEIAELSPLRAFALRLRRICARRFYGARRALLWKRPLRRKPRRRRRGLKTTAAWQLTLREEEDSSSTATSSSSWCSPQFSYYAGGGDGDYVDGEEKEDESDTAQPSSPPDALDEEEN